ncbi:transmembrane protein 18-like [Limulus polyphemus]|uniref:Transmembrane protein 18 n=1 Tax=Limulus polyphemus TaxID=6850 RepID=A0ABM1B097_LIMPO|nr:transmembrane protein 18-like [Limulus polyphemus]XP_013772147.1 transmembrane protein 18-like [Limulus polyphemus]XP_013772148.1 transmembrane protein 18-like [Limulus polyphemus]XP_022238879.1 transmembrane protein 18-like [Limulus polyphemus]
MNPAGTVKVGIESKEIFSIMKLLEEVDWTEPWIILLLVFHGFITVLAVVTRNHGNIQAVLFCLLLLMVYFSEVLNEWAARNWRLFARDQYFDSSGVFISIMFAAPSLLNCLFLVCQWLWISGTLLIKAKQAQLRSQVQQQHADGSSQQVRGSDRTYRRDTSDFSGREKCD